MTMMRSLALFTALVASLVASVVSFTPMQPKVKRLTTRLSAFEEEIQDYNQWYGGGRAYAGTTVSLHDALEARKDELRRGIGRRFVVRTQRGFLNVHYTFEGGPHRTDNIVRQLTDGEIVTSVDRFQDWIKHDAGGWSIAKYGGFVWLVPIKE